MCVYVCVLKTPFFPSKYEIIPMQFLQFYPITNSTLCY